MYCYKGFTYLLWPFISLWYVVVISKSYFSNDIPIWKGYHYEAVRRLLLELTYLPWCAYYREVLTVSGLTSGVLAKGKLCRVLIWYHHQRLCINLVALCYLDYRTPHPLFKVSLCAYRLSYWLVSIGYYGRENKRTL